MDSNHDNPNPRRICKLQSFQWSKMPEKARKTTTRTQLVHGRIDPAAHVTGSRLSGLGGSLDQYPLLAVGRPDQNVINGLPSANLRSAAFDGKRLRVTVEWLWRSSIGRLSKVAIATRRNAQEPHECASHRIDAAETRSEGHMLKPVISAF